jgi:hypothetical protein
MTRTKTSQYPHKGKNIEVFLRGVFDILDGGLEGKKKCLDGKKRDNDSGLKIEALSFIGIFNLICVFS